MLTNERPSPVAVVVDGLRRQVLAGPGLAGQQHGRGRAGCHTRQDRLDLRHGRRRTDDGVEPILTALRRAQRPDLAPETARLESLVDEQHDFVEVEGLVDVVVRTTLHRLDGVLDGGKRGHEDHRRFWRSLFDVLQNAETIPVRQLEIKQHQIDVFRGVLNGSGRSLGLEDVVSLLLEALLQRPPQQRLVIDDQQRGTGHLCSISGGK